MNEEQIKKLCDTYRESLGTCDRSRIVPRTRSWTRSLVYAACVVGIAVTVVGIWPRDAAAAALSGMTDAIRDVLSMQHETWARGDGGEWMLVAEIRSAGKRWRSDTRLNLPLRATYITRDGWLFTDYAALDHATIQRHPIDAVNAEGFPSALDYAKQRLELGNVSDAPVTSIRPHADLGGRATYEIVLDRPSTHAVIVVDRGTELPIEADATVSYPGQKSLTYVHEEFRFNVPIPDGAFSFRSAKPVINLESAQAALAKTWAHSVANLGSTEIQDACITSDGTVWIAVTTDDSGGPLVLPSRIRTASGTRYARLHDLVSGAILGHQGTFKVGGKRLYVVGFAPLSAPKSESGAISISFAKREPWLPGFSQPEDRREEDLGAEVVQAHDVHADRPPYFTAIDLDHFGFSLPIMICTSRAKGFEEIQDWVGAGRAHEQAARAYLGFIGRVDVPQLRRAGGAYRKGGALADAERVEKEADALWAPPRHNSIDQ